MPPIVLDSNQISVDDVRWSGFISSFSVVLFSELFDKTFFITAVMAMKHSKIFVFLGTASALLLMTILSACLGSLSIKILPPQYIAIISSCAMYVFGFKMFYEAYAMDEKHSEKELEDARMEIHRQKHLQNIDEVSFADAICCFGRNIKNAIWSFFSMPCCQTMMLVFVAEWGDRSQISTMVLAANKNVMSVIIGAFLGHCACTIIAILGSSLLSRFVSVKAVTFFGGLTFVLFATYGLFHNYNMLD